MTTVQVVIEVPDNWLRTIRAFGPEGRLEVGGFFGRVLPVRITGTLSDGRFIPLEATP